MHPSIINKFLLLLLILYSNTSFVSLVSPNEKYIQKVTSNQKKLCKKGEFIPGRIFFSNDTIETDILCFNNSRSKNYYLFVVSRINNSINIFTAEDIAGYEVNHKQFFKHSVSDQSFFILRTKQGKVDLYERRSIPGDDRYIYYIKLKNSEKLFAISPDEDNIEEHFMPPDSHSKSNDNRGRTFYTSKNIERKFKQFINLHFSNCVEVKNSVETEFLTINNIPEIIEMYNRCFD